jgi:alpha-tubulin suppressor-like RCC1 family protein
MAVGGAHACALLEEGRVRCWGESREGQAGVLSARVRADAPVEVSELPSVRALSAGARHTCAQTEAGEVWCWGANTRGQLGFGPFAGGPHPQRVELGEVTSVASGRSHSCAVLLGGAVACWGDNRRRAIGAIDPHMAPVPVAIPGVSAVQVSASCEATCARRQDDTVVCWGGRYRVSGRPAGQPVFLPFP